MTLEGKTVLVTGGTRRIGKAFAIAIARAGGDVILHYAHSALSAEATREEIISLGRKAYIIQSNFEDENAAAHLIDQAREFGPLFAVVNNAAIFEPLTWNNTTIQDWNKHLSINLSAPFLISRAFALSLLDSGQEGRIVNILDWRALRPGIDHLPYTISKAALVALTRSLARALAPKITVNGLALGAILPPENETFDNHLIEIIPSRRWAELEEVCQALLFLLTGPSYITGEIIHVDGGRHLV